MAKNAGWLVAACVIMGSAIFFAGTFFRNQEVTAQVGGAAGDLIAVSAEDNSGFPVLFVLDAKTRHMAVYRAEPANSRLKLVSARNVDWDLQIPLEYPPRRINEGGLRDPTVLRIRQAVIEALKEMEQK